MRNCMGSSSHTELSCRENALMRLKQSIADKMGLFVAAQNL